MAQPLNDLVIVGTEAAPIALGALASATDLWTWTHSKGAKAVKIEVLDATSRQVLGPAEDAAPSLKAVIATQASTSIITLQNQSTVAVNVILRATWEDLSQSIGKAELASVGVLS
jgi:hypothetical protein